MTNYKKYADQDCKNCFGEGSRQVDQPEPYSDYDMPCECALANMTEEAEFRSNLATEIYLEV